MKKILFIFFCGSLALACKKSAPDGDVLPAKSKSCSMVGRWVIMSSTLYEYTDSLRYTIYSADGKFGTIKDAIPNPKRWWMEGDTVCVEISRTSIQKFKPSFPCDCNVVETISDDFGSHTKTRIYKEGFDIKNCPW
jgi:hypothetical protein